MIHPALHFVIASVFCYQMLAAKSLKTESMKVYDQLEQHNIEGARKAVSMIVGRDTANLTEEQIAKAAVETVAENTSDGVIAPLFFMLIGGAPLGFFYKSVNTMDSMIGYRNEHYQYFGTAAAKLDDILNYIPARISAYLMILAAFLHGMIPKKHFVFIVGTNTITQAPTAHIRKPYVQAHCIFNWPVMHITLESCTKSRPSAMPTVP